MVEDPTKDRLAPPAETESCWINTRSQRLKEEGFCLPFIFLGMLLACEALLGRIAHLIRLPLNHEVMALLAPTFFPLRIPFNPGLLSSPRLHGIQK
jgi:hypothetical protein